MIKLLKSLVLASSLAILAAGGAGAETFFAAVIDGSQPVPPTGSPATGTALLVLNDSMDEVAYEIEFEGLLGEETSAHFHNAAPGQNGGVIFGLPLGSPKVGVWPVGPFEVDELLAGRVYVNVHSTEHPSGEIRGDIGLIETPAEQTSWGNVKALY